MPQETNQEKIKEQEQPLIEEQEQSDFDKYTQEVDAIEEFEIEW